MISKPIKLHNISLQLPHKICFQDFNAEIPYGSHIAIIGRNGSGKSALLKAIAGNRFGVCEGYIEIPAGTKVGYVEQIPEGFNNLSGAEQFNAALSRALAIDPDLLLLDEPTNHLDRSNRKSLLRHLQNYYGTLIIASHDTELLRTCADTLWHIDQGKVNVISSNYDNYTYEQKLECNSLEKELSNLKHQKKATHLSLMKEQERASKSKAKGKKMVRDKTLVKIISNAYASSAKKAHGKKHRDINDKSEDINARIADLYMPEVIKPKFSLTASYLPDKVIVSVSGQAGYESGIMINDIIFSLTSRCRIAITGCNGSGKTTVLRAIKGSNEVITTGQWNAPKLEDIGYLDQHYSTLDLKLSVFESIAILTPHWSHAEVREHLNDFLFRKNEEVNAKVLTLSGGEKARLSLAQIAAKTPKLLILDEITNNLDLETKEHVTQVLKEYPGAIIVVSHDEDFLNQIGIVDRIEIGRH